MAKKPLDIQSLKHNAAKRRNIPTAEFESVMREEEKSAVRIAYERRNRDLDPQLVWRGKDEQDWSDLVVAAPPLYIQEKVHPKVLIDDLVRRSRSLRKAALASSRGAEPRGDPVSGAAPGEWIASPSARNDGKRAARNDGKRAARDDKAGVDRQPDLFADFNGVADLEAKTEFYQHDQNWSNRMILGDSLQVMASLAEREGLRGKVQCIYLDPPYGIKFNSNFQWSTTSRDVKDGNAGHITREPEQVKAFRDTWRDGIHSYLTYLRDRLTVARDLLADSGSIFVQIGDENVHRVRALMDEVFGEDNFVAIISITKTTSATNEMISSVADYVVWFTKRRDVAKYRQIYKKKAIGGDGAEHYGGILLQDGNRRAASLGEKNGSISIPEGAAFFTADQLQSAGMGREKGKGAALWFRVDCEGRTFTPTLQSRWKTNEVGMERLKYSLRLIPQLNALRYLRKIDDFSAYALNNIWPDVGGASDKRYVVETSPRIVERCILMATDPGDLVLDPTCGSGTTAYVAEQWGRRWITIDTSRVALALARARIMGARYPWYILADSPEGQRKEWEISGKPPPSSQATSPSLRKAPQVSSRGAKPRGDPLSAEAPDDWIASFSARNDGGEDDSGEAAVAGLRPTRGDIRHGFVYEPVPHITLKSIANNAEIDVIWEKWQAELEPLRAALNAALGRTSPSSSGLSRGSTTGGGEGVDGRDKHGHDGGEGAVAAHSPSSSGLSRGSTTGNGEGVDGRDQHGHEVGEERWTSRG